MNQERRKYPRIKKDLPLKLSHQEFDIITQTENLSCTGAYCKVNRLIPLMTKLKITILLPLERTKKSHSENTKVVCRGVVVRAEKKMRKSLFSIILLYFLMR